MSALNPKHHVKRIVSKARRVNQSLKYYLSVARDYTFSIDNPRKKMLDSSTVSVEGWIIPKNDKSFKLRVRNNERTYPVKMELKRLDVSKAYPELDVKKALHSGFQVEFEFEDGELAIEIDQGHGYKQLFKTTIQYGLENLPSSIYNKDLSNNYPEHVNLLDNRQSFYYEPVQQAHYQPHPKDARLMAIYLPQFHPFTENDKAWGKGFTEWTNVTTAQPRFIGHQQPILPKDLGFYDLRLESKILEQIELAKRYGIHGFSFYYYWFSGRKIMDAPLESFLSHKEWDFNFSICWANENWTKRWDGRDSDVIIAQEYLEDDPLNFIKDVEHILLDPRYVKENGKPVLTVYRASELKDPARYAAIWREYMLKKHAVDLQLVSCLSFDDQDPREYGFDAALDFAPLSAFFKNNLFSDSKFPYNDVSQKMLDINFSGIVADYRTIACNERLSQAYDFPTYQCVTPSWDNDARKKGKGFVYQNSSPDLYAQWLERLIVQESDHKTAPLIYINAWNEWAEGAMLEPSMHLGHAVLNRTAEVMARHSHNAANRMVLPAYGVKRAAKTRLAVIVHLYYVDLWPEIRKGLSNITQPYDLFITLNAKDKDFEVGIDDRQVKVYRYVVPNRGRDVLPFLYVLNRIQPAGYEYVLKLHSKKSKHRNDGTSWFGEMLQTLLPNKYIVDQALRLLQDKTTGIIGPQHHLVSLSRHMGSNRSILKHFLNTAYSTDIAQKVMKNPERYPYFGGTMFWARVDALEPLRKLYLMPDDFQSEHGQIDGTTAHALERMISVCSWMDDRKLYEISVNKLNLVPAGDYRKKYEYAP